jgi:hypothetical protein
VTVTGEQVGLLVGFEMTQVFVHTNPGSVDIRYVTPNDCSQCVYDTTFRVGAEVLKPVLQAKGVAERQYEAARREGRTAVLGSNLGNGLVEFKVGNVAQGVPVSVTMKLALTAASKGERETQFKFPLDVATPSGSVSCVTKLLTGAFDFTFRTAGAESVTANVAGTFEHGQFRVTAKPEASALVLTTVHKEPLRSSVLTWGNLAAVTLFETGQPREEERREGERREEEEEPGEFVFLVDCSGSMAGERTRRAKECLKLLLGSLPEGCLFNIVRFGWRYEQLFKEGSERYTEATVARAREYTKELRADLGGTELLEPLEAVTGRALGGGRQRQVFVLTDGEVSNTEEVLACARRNAEKSRCFTLGIGTGADAGLVQGLAHATGGQADFVLDGSDPSEKVIPQLALSFVATKKVEVEPVGAESLEVSPYPVPSLTPGVALTFFVRGSGPVEGVVINGEQLRRTGEAGPLGHALLPLFAYETLAQFESEEKKGKKGAEEQQEAVLVQLSVESGVLCSRTAFVGASERVYAPPAPAPTRSTATYDAYAFTAYAAPRPSYGRGAAASQSRGRQQVLYEAEYEQVSASDDDDDGCCYAEGSCDSERSCCDDASACDDDGCCCCCCAAEDRSSCGSDDERSCASCSRDDDQRSCASSDEEGLPPAVPEPALVSGTPAPAAKAGSEEAFNESQFDLSRVTDLQEVDGSWREGGAVARAAGVRAELWADLARVEGGAVIFATILALALLRAKAGARKAAWFLLERKALGWLKARGVEAEPLISRALAEI